MLFNKPRSLVLPGHFFGCIGQMLPAAIGAVAASGNKPHVLCDGDASVMMHVGEFETAVRYGMPLMVVCLNNQALGSEYYKFDAHKMKADLATVRRRTWAPLARPSAAGAGLCAAMMSSAPRPGSSWRIPHRRCSTSGFPAA